MCLRLGFLCGRIRAVGEIESLHQGVWSVYSGLAFQLLDGRGYGTDPLRHGSISVCFRGVCEDLLKLSVNDKGEAPQRGHGRLKTDQRPPVQIAVFYKSILYHDNADFDSAKHDSPSEADDWLNLLFQLCFACMVAYCPHHVSRKRQEATNKVVLIVRFESWSRQ